MKILREKKLCQLKNFVSKNYFETVARRILYIGTLDVDRMRSVSP